MQIIRLLILFIGIGSSLYAQNFTQIGDASFYANKFEGRMTASGEIFSNQKMTAAHKTLPFGTLVRVTNLSNNKFVEVTINDRGPFIKGRIIDLSQVAARKLGFYVQGTTRVRITAINPHREKYPLKPLPSQTIDSFPKYPINHEEVKQLLCK